MKKQVDSNHYDFGRYLSKRRWISTWHQIDEVVSLRPTSVLEIGPGPGVLKATARLFGVQIETLDLDPALNPDHIAPAEAMPFETGAFDVVCAFQMLEHVPFELSRAIFQEMARVSRHNVIISLPDARPTWRYTIHIPRYGQCKFSIPRPFFKPRRHQFDNQHYWEINKEDYSLTRVVGEYTSVANIRLVRTYRVHENPYHRFFLFEK